MGTIIILHEIDNHSTQSVSASVQELADFSTVYSCFGHPYGQNDPNGNMYHEKTKASLTIVLYLPIHMTRHMTIHMIQICGRKMLLL